MSGWPGFGMMRQIVRMSSACCRRRDLRSGLFSTLAVLALLGAAPSRAAEEGAADRLEPGKHEIGWADGKISVTANAVPAAALLRAIALKSGVTLEIELPLAKKLTLETKAATVPEAVAEILRQIDPDCKLALTYRAPKDGSQRVLTSIVATSGRQAEALADAPKVRFRDLSPAARKQRLERQRRETRIGAPRLLANRSLLVKSLPKAQLIAPPEPMVKPPIVHPIEYDLDKNGVDDLIESKLAEANVFEAAGKNAEARALRLEKIRVQLLFRRQIDQRQIDDFVRVGGIIDYIYQAVSYGWNGVITREAAQKMPALMGAGMVAVTRERRVDLCMDEATQTGRVRPIWAIDFAGTTGLRGSGNIAIAVIDTGVDESHSDLTGRMAYWRDFTTDASATPEDVRQHGSHVTGSATGTGASGGAATTTLQYTDSGDLSTLGQVGGSPIHMPAGTVTFNSTAYWDDGDDSTYYHYYRDDGDTGFLTALGSSTGPSPLDLQEVVASASGRQYGSIIWLTDAPTTTLVALVNNVSYAGVGDGFNTFSGVAPNCLWVGAKVFANAGGGGSSADIGAAIDDMVAQRQTYNIKVANMSLGGGIDTGLRSKTNAAVDSGIVMVISAGNDGPGDDAFSEIGDPGRAGKALTVGASNDVNELTIYTSSGFLDYDDTEDLKPDLLAPGGSPYYSQIMSVDSNTCDAEDISFADRQADDYLNINGTSMASPFAAGAAAIVIQALELDGVSWDFNTGEHALLTKMLLCATATETGGSREVGAGFDPTVGRAAAPKDRFEGYGMINPDAAVQCILMNLDLDAGLPINDSTNATVSDQRAWGRNIDVSAGDRLILELAVPLTGDYDIYLYSDTPDARGNPVCLASATDRRTRSEASRTWRRAASDGRCSLCNSASSCISAPVAS